ncbi:hypothetical protein LA080_011719 [Diaporthe eres]|nr:hypothetical protein LA080_011719 [Diaporthe eres]
MSTYPGPYQPPDVTLPPAALGDPFLDVQPVGTGFPPHPSRVMPTYRLPGIDQNILAEYQSFAANRTVPPGHHLSPLETYVARSQERQVVTTSIGSKHSLIESSTFRYPFCSPTPGHGLTKSPRIEQEWPDPDRHIDQHTRLHRDIDNQDENREDSRLLRVIKRPRCGRLLWRWPND